MKNIYTMIIVAAAQRGSVPVILQQVQGMIWYIMAGMAVDIAEIKANTGSNTSTLPVLVISSGNGDTLSSGQAPVIAPNNEYLEYLVYVSSTITLSTTTTGIVLHSNQELQDRWAELESIATDGKIYITLRGIEGGNVTDLSNVLTYNTTY